MISASYDLFKLRGHDSDVRTEYLHLKFTWKEMNKKLNA